MQIDKNTYKLTKTGNFSKYALAIGLIGLVSSFVGYFINSEQFFHSYLTAFVFWITLALGGLFFTMLHHLTNAKWSIVLRRITENLMITLPVMVIFLIPLFFGIRELYHWSHGDVVASDILLQKKSVYLNTPFFIIRSVIYFGIWILFSVIFFNTSIKQDSGFKESQVKIFKKAGPPGMILFALTLTFASFDWLMSLDAHWYSTIFGVYIFGGSILSVLSFIIIISQYFRHGGVLENTITIEHYHDLGRLLFAFVIFWAYITFSQYFLIWYANIPEETSWFIIRWEGNWKYISLVIIFGHFILPFFILITGKAKRNLKILLYVSSWILIMHWVDIYWIVMPNLHQNCVHISWMDFTTLAGIGGIFIWYFRKRVAANLLMPVNDPRIEESINFKN